MDVENVSVTSKEEHETDSTSYSEVTGSTFQKTAYLNDNVDYDASNNTGLRLFENRMMRKVFGPRKK
jgi:hypothetical protein